ncbi:MAG: hypothetical protein ACLUEQ_09125 [Cloacibacillus evryensis]
MLARALGLPINSLGGRPAGRAHNRTYQELRRAGDSKALGKASDLKSMMKALQNGDNAVPVDQDAKGWAWSRLSRFSGKTPVGPAKLAAKSRDVILEPCGGRTVSVLG